MQLANVLNCPMISLAWACDRMTSGELFTQNIFAIVSQKPAMLLLKCFIYIYTIKQILVASKQRRIFVLEL